MGFELYAPRHQWADMFPVARNVRGCGGRRRATPLSPRPVDDHSQAPAALCQADARENFRGPVPSARHHGRKPCAHEFKLRRKRHLPSRRGAGVKSTGRLRVPTSRAPL